jgi:hypothetical protein
MTRDDDPALVDPAEVAALLRWPEECVRSLMAGAFGAEPCGRLRQRPAFGLFVLGQLGARSMLAPELAVQAAWHAGASANEDGAASLLVGWDDAGKPVIGRFDDDNPPPVDPRAPASDPLTRPAVLIPIDRMYDNFLGAVRVMRQRAQAVAH